MSHVNRKKNHTKNESLDLVKLWTLISQSRTYLIVLHATTVWHARSVENSRKKKLSNVNRQKLSYVNFIAFSFSECRKPEKLSDLNRKQFELYHFFIIFFWCVLRMHNWAHSSLSQQWLKLFLVNCTAFSLHSLWLQIHTPSLKVGFPPVCLSMLIPSL